jgi:MraZ protein
VLLGLFEQRLDDKNRVTIPAKLREHFEDGAVITRGFDGCLQVFDVTSWGTFCTNQLYRADVMNGEGRQLRRMFENYAIHAELDGQGRIGIPPHLIALAALDRDVVVAGSGDRLEIWDRDTYRQYMMQMEGRVESVAERVASESSR